LQRHASGLDGPLTDTAPPQAAPPKTKYIEHILVATHAGEAGVGEVFRALQYRLRDSTWTIVLKSLITVHLMIREGSPDVTLAYLAKHRNMLAVSVFSDGKSWSRLPLLLAIADIATCSTNPGPQHPSLLKLPLGTSASLQGNQD
jgi:hypothetical protein